MNYTAEIEAQFAVLANPEKAFAMQKYMKDHFPFLGIPAPLRKVVFQELFKEIKHLSIEERWQLIFELWEKQEREFQYFAVEIILRIKKNEWTVMDLQQIEKLLVTKSWWDSVDLIASYACSALAQQFPLEFDETVLRWTKSSNIWLQRSTLLYQLKWKSKTDLTILSRQIQSLKGINTFFIQKAIGWCLREYAKTNPDWVKIEVEKQHITGLAKREALKHLSN